MVAPSFGAVENGAAGVDAGGAGVGIGVDPGGGKIIVPVIAGIKANDPTVLPWTSPENQQAANHARDVDTTLFVALGKKATDMTTLEAEGHIQASLVALGTTGGATEQAVRLAWAERVVKGR